MATLDLSQNGPSITRSYKSLIESPPAKNPSPTFASWAVYSVSAPLQNAFQQGPPKNSVVKVHSTGEGELQELIEEFNDGKVQFAFVKVKDTNTGLAKYVLIGWCGEGVPERVKGYFTGHMNAISKVLHGYHVEITARSDSDLSPESIIEKVANASGAKYSAATTTPINRPPPPTSFTKPAYNPTRTSGSAFNPSRSAAYGRTGGGKVDSDGWGEDAPQVNKTQLEKVVSAYQPTKVDMAALRAQPSSTTSGFQKPEPVRGAYEPVGKVDIAAIRAASKQKEERPEPVKGAYQPIGKVDIAAIRAQAKPRPDDTPARVEPEEPPKSLSERSAAFSQPPPKAERLTSLPKPKVAKKFGPGAPSFGTKPLAPGGFGAVPTAAPVGTANKDFASQGGKTPAQIWAEKKARERGEVTPTGSQGAISATSTGNRSADRREEEEAPAPGVSAMRNKFAGMQMSSPQHAARSASPPPPSPPVQSRPSLAGSGAIAMPGFPPRPHETEEDESAPPPPPAQPPRSPTPPSPRTPEIPGSPVRIIMPVGRGDDEEPVQRVPEEPRTSIPTESLSRVVPREEELDEEEPARARGAIAAEETTGGGKRARVEYDYEKADTNEIDLIENEIITDIDEVDKDWWAGTNPRGENGLFPSNYVVLLEEEEAAPLPPSRAPAQREETPEPVAPPQPGAQGGKYAFAEYDYDATEENELTFPEGALIEDIDFPDADWWEGTYAGERGLFPSNYVVLQN